MCIDSDWIMHASSDFQCRAVRLWQYGLLDRLRPHLEHKIIACAHDGDGWGILMRDLTGKVYSWQNPMSPRLIPIFLDRLARLHATYWDDPRLQDEQLGLCDPTRMFDQTSLVMAQKMSGRQFGVLPDWIKGGWEVMADLLEQDVFEALLSLDRNPRPLLEALSLYPTTLVHGDYRAENLAYQKPNHTVALDWQNSTCSLMAIDLIWFTKQGYVRDVIGEEHAIETYRERLESYLSDRLDETAWQAMLDLGYLVDAVRATCFSAYWYKHSDTPEGRNWNEQAVKRSGRRARNALDRLREI
jgi:hypothetical protein